MTQAVGKSKAMEMILTGKPIGAKEALNWGLVSQVHPKDKLIDEAIKLATSMAKHSQISLALAKRSIKMSLEVGETAAIDHERTAFIALMDTHDKKEGVSAFLQKRKAKF